MLQPKREREVKEFMNWTEQISSSGRSYFYNRETEVSQWDKPQEWKEYDMRMEQERINSEQQRMQQLPPLPPPPMFMSHQPHPHGPQYMPYPPPQFGPVPPFGQMNTPPPFPPSFHPQFGHQPPMNCPPHHGGPQNCPPHGPMMRMNHPQHGPPHPSSSGRHNNPGYIPGPPPPPVMSGGGGSSGMNGVHGGDGGYNRRSPAGGLPAPITQASRTSSSGNNPYGPNRASNGGSQSQHPDYKKSEPNKPPMQQQQSSYGKPAAQSAQQVIKKEELDEDGKKPVKREREDSKSPTEDMPSAKKSKEDEMEINWRKYYDEELVKKKRAELFMDDPLDQERKELVLQALTLENKLVLELMKMKTAAALIAVQEHEVVLGNGKIANFQEQQRNLEERELRNREQIVIPSAIRSEHC